MTSEYLDTVSEYENKLGEMKILFELQDDFNYTSFFLNIIRNQDDYSTWCYYRNDINFMIFCSCFIDFVKEQNLSLKYDEWKLEDYILFKLISGLDLTKNKPERIKNVSTHR